jgi:hypothetical protein
MRKQEEVQRCPNCMTWCFRNKIFNWQCPECGTIIRRKMNSVVAPYLERRDFIKSGWDTITHA